MYRTDERNQFLEVTYQNGDKEIMYFKDFSSGRHDREHRARAKKLAIKRLIGRRRRGHPHRGPPRRRSTRSTRSTRTCPTRPTPTTGPRSRARRASASSTSARSCATRTRTTTPPAAASIEQVARPASTCSASRHRTDRTPATGRVAAWRSRRSAASRPSTGSSMRGADESNPIAASSLLINAYLHELASRQHRATGPQGGLGLRGRVTRPRRPGHAARRARSPPRSRPIS